MLRCLARKSMLLECVEKRGRMQLISVSRLGKFCHVTAKF